MSTTRGETNTLAVLAGSLGWLLHPAVAQATPPWLAAAHALPAPLVSRTLSASTSLDVLLVRPGGAVTVTSLPFAALLAMRGEEGEVSAGAIRRPLLDQSVPYVHADEVQQAHGLTGTGALVAVIDSGLDVTHADFVSAEGHTRVAWMLDLSLPARGVHPDLEQAFGIVRDGVMFGAVYSADDIDALLAVHPRSPALPQDELGHGTWVASIAAGNGRATGNGEAFGRYVGMAPGAELIIVRASSAAPTEGFSDAALVTGVQFAVDRATAMQRPVAINLSLGSHEGSHDGNAPLERALAAAVPMDAPGRALVASAGNDGGTRVHARVDLFSTTPGEMVLALPEASENDLVVVEVAYEGTATIGARFADGSTTDAVAMGHTQAFGTGEAVASIANATDVADPEELDVSLTPNAGVHTATVIFAGDPQGTHRRRGGRYAVRVAGHGPVHAWIEDAGQTLPLAAFVAGTIDDGTMTVPATSASLVAVGSVETRVSWPSALGGTTTHEPMLVAPGAVSSFSSRGPNRVNQLRPDLTAPGEWVLAALSGQSVPGSDDSIFADASWVASDGVHAAGAGTSGAAPHVTGAMALLLGAHPGATQRELLSALAGTAQPAIGESSWSPSQGWGVIDVEGALAAMDARAGSGAVDGRTSTIAVGASTVVPGESVAVTLRLRDAAGRPVLGAIGVMLTASAGEIGAVIEEGGGRYTTTWRALGVSSPTSVQIAARAAGTALGAQAAVSVVREVANVSGSYAATGGCEVGPGRGGGWILAALTATRGRRRRRPTNAR